MMADAISDELKEEKAENASYVKDKSMGNKTLPKSNMIALGAAILFNHFSHRSKLIYTL